MNRIHIGIPVYGEREWLPRTLAALDRQTDLNFQVWICVNQPAELFFPEKNPGKRFPEKNCLDKSRSGEHLRETRDETKKAVTRNNLATLEWLHSRRHRFNFPLHILPAVEPPSAPPLKISGVGWARRFIFDSVSAAENKHKSSTDSDTLCISMDADTLVDDSYVENIRAAFSHYRNAVALAAPYYHRLPEREGAALRILRYEIYLRYYQLSLWRIGSPYAFMPLGSGMAFRLASYRRIGGIPRKKAGEDFYFLQQLRKTGPVIRWLDSLVYPSPRPSARNPFGTGAVMGETGLALLERRYPFYAQSAFDLIAETFARFPSLHERDIDLPLGEFVERRLQGYRTFARLRRNCSRPEQFVKACHEKFDALRTLQFLRFHHQRCCLQRGESAAAGMENINGLLTRMHKSTLDFETNTRNTVTLNAIRDTLFACESEFQREFMRCWDHSARW